MRIHPWRLVLATLVLGGGTGCGGGRGPSVSGDPGPGYEECQLTPGSVGVPDTIRISFIDGFRPERSPVADSEADRILHRHLYETLVGVDCQGQAIPGLARDWSSRSGGTEWEFRLRSGARFSDGTPLEAEDVRESWMDLLTRFPERRRYPPWVWVRPESIRTLGTDRILIRLRGSTNRPATIFANPELAVTRSLGAGVAPLGSGPYAPLGTGGSDLICRSNPFHPRPGRSPLRFIPNEGADPRDLLSGAGDLVMISQREDIEYAAHLPGRRTFPLPWSRLYLLLAPRAVCDRAAAGPGEGGLPELREELALRILQRDARPAPVFAFEEPTVRCADPADPPGPHREPATSRILTWERDPDAGRIASRLVALEQVEPDGSNPHPAIPCLALTEGPVAEAAPWTGWMPALIAGRDAGYILSVRRTFPDPCLEWDALPVRIPWLERVVPGIEGAAGTPAMIPLVATRDHVVLRNGLVGVAVAWDGIPILSRAVWDRVETVP